MPSPGQRPTYFVPANFDFPPPPEGPVRLGQLITQPENPGRAVDPAGPVPFDEVVGMKRHTNSTQFSLQRLDASTAEVGLFGRAVQVVGAKLGLNISHAAVSYVLNDIEKLDVEFIEPNDDYVKAAMERPRAKEALKKKGVLRKRLYMITGIKTAYPGAKLDRTDASDTRIVGGVAVSGPAGAGNVGAEGSAKFSTSEMAALALVPAEPFVYGYRLQECYYSIRSLRDREYVDGALFGVGSGIKEPKDVAEEEEGEDIEIEFNGMDEEDLCDWEPEESGCEFEVVSVVDEGDGLGCDVIVPIVK